MAATDKIADHNLLQTTNWTFRVRRLPNISYTVQEVVLPGVYSGSPLQPTPFKMIPHAGEQLTYDPLILTFKVNENLDNWLEIYDWLTGLGKPKSFDQYAELANTSPFSGEGIESDLELVFLTSHRNFNVHFTFEDAFPIRLSGFKPKTTEAGQLYLDATVHFDYKIYTVRKINSSEVH